MVVTGDLPLGWVLGVETAVGVVVVAGAVVVEAVERRAGELLVRGNRRPSGLVPYWTVWKSLKQQATSLID